MIVREYEEDEITVHKAPIILAGSLIAITIALTTSVSLGYFDRQAVPEVSRAQAGTMSVATRSLLFFDESDGTVRVEDANTRKEISSYGPGTGGFVRSTVRSLVHERRINGIGRATPFELIEWESGDLTLRDTTTGQTIELASFGGSNRATFAAMLETGTIPALASAKKKEKR